MDLLALSNGHGEDAIAAYLLSRLAERHPSRQLAGFALVGEGRAYDRANVPVVFRSRPMPSEGFGWQSPRLFAQDLAAGFLSLTAAQMDALRRLRDKVRALLLVGDIYPVLLTLPYRVPKVMVATARSDYIAPHLAVESRILAHFCRLVFTRDGRTASGLLRKGVPAVWVGNVMMDLVQAQGHSLALDPARPVLALLPGSRRDAPANLVALLGVVERVWAARPEVQVVAAVARDLSGPWAQFVQGGWRLAPVGEPERAAGLDGVLEKGPRRVGLTLRAFGDLLHRATVALGLAGTANEQAAGLGVPVVAFPVSGVQYTRRFAARQKRLLGDALVLTQGPEQAADEVLRVLDDPDERRRRGEAGRARMGPPGAAERMAGWIERALGWCSTCPGGAATDEGR